MLMTQTHGEKAPRIAAPHPLHSTTQLAALGTHAPKHTLPLSYAHTQVLNICHIHIFQLCQKCADTSSPNTSGFSPISLVWCKAFTALLPINEQYRFMLREPTANPSAVRIGSGQPKHWNSLRPRQLQHRSDINLSTGLAGRSAGWLVGTEPAGRGESATQTAKKWGGSQATSRCIQLQRD